MYLEHLHIQNFKLIGDIQLSFLNTEDFVDEDGTQHQKGEPRMFTVLIGKNARGKTSILQAIALAMSKETTANLLVDGRVNTVQKLQSLSNFIIEAIASEPTSISKLNSIVKRNINEITKIEKDPQTPNESAEIINSIFQFLSNTQKKEIINQTIINQLNLKDREAHNLTSMLTAHTNPFSQFIAMMEHIQPSSNFIVSYSTTRNLPQIAQVQADNPPLNRLQPLFSATHQINGTNFIEHLRAVDRTPDKAMSRGYLKILEDLLSSDLGLLPEVKALRARGTGEIPEEDYLALEHRVVTTIGGHEIEVPTTWLSQGYQAMFSWIADMIGWACLEQKRAVPPEEIEGIALIDEIDLFLHPTWQVRLIPTLKKLFPKVQFIVTTHSPLVLSSLRPDEIVVLELDDETGELVAHNGPGQVPDPRLRTMGELASEFFAINRLYPKALDDMWNEYRRIANDPHRTDEEQARGEHLMAQLTAQGKPPAAMVPREEVEQDGWEE